VDGDAKLMLEIKVNLGAKAVSYKISRKNAYYELRDPCIPFSPLFTVKKCGLSSENSYYWMLFH
jgi:hypothetical protein